MGAASSEGPKASVPTASAPTAVLEGKGEETYVRDVVRILRSARLNNYYPNPRLLGSHIQCMGAHGGLYAGITVDLRSGLPTYKEWTRVVTDQSVAEDSLASMKSEEHQAATAERHAIYGKQLLKRRYYTELLNKPLSPLSAMKVTLRRVEPDKNLAHFNVILDKLDVSGLFVRYTIDLAQESSVWNHAMVTLNEDDAAHTEGFRSLVYQFTSFDAEFTFAKLSSIGGLTVERVVKGVVGPFFFAGMRAPAPVTQMLEADGTFLATFALDMAACDIPQDKDNDPLDELLVAQLSEKARESYDAMKERAGYCVFKDRKFVVPRELTTVVGSYCQAAGTRNIIYPAR